jgi:hypothetical protein
MVHASADNIDTMVDDQPIVLRESDEQMRKHTTQPQPPVPASGQNSYVRAGGLRQRGHASSEPSETPWWWITLRLAAIPHIALHIALQLLFHRVFSLHRSPILHEHSGVVANCDHTQEWVNLVCSSIGIARY